MLGLNGKLGDIIGNAAEAPSNSDSPSGGGSKLSGFLNSDTFSNIIGSLGNTIGNAVSKGNQNGGTVYLPPSNNQPQNNNILIVVIISAVAIIATLFGLKGGK